MCIERISNGTVKISLDKQDLERLNISYANIDSSGVKTKQVLLKILDNVRKKETDFAVSSSKIFVEIFPIETGLAIYFTEMKDETAPKQSDTGFSSPYEFSFSSLDLLISGCSLLLKYYSRCIFKSCLFKLDNVYHLLIYPTDPKDESSVKLLSDFGTFNGRGERCTAYLNEHAKVMLKKDAVDKLAALI